MRVWIAGILACVFLQEQEVESFRREFGERSLVITVHPKRPAVGDLVRCTVKVCPRGREDRPLEISRGTAMVNSSIIYQLQELPKGAYGFSTSAEREGILRIDIDVDIEEDRFEASTAFDVPVGPARIKAVDPKNSKEVMSEIGRLWADLHQQVEERREPDRDRLEKIRGLQRSIASWTPRKFPERKAEFDRIAEEFGRDLDALAASKDFRKDFRRVDLYSCTRCHLVFRWGSIQDIGRFPELVDERVKK